MSSGTVHPQSAAMPAINNATPTNAGRQMQRDNISAGECLRKARKLKRLAIIKAMPFMPISHPNVCGETPYITGSTVGAPAT